MTTEKGGRPALFDNPEEQQKKIREYQIDCPDTKKIKIADEIVTVPAYSIAGLAYFLGFESRQSFYDYEKNGMFSYIMKRARLFIEKEYELLLQTSTNSASIIFALKNMGWKDRTEVEQTNLTLAEKIKQAKERQQNNE